MSDYKQLRAKILKKYDKNKNGFVEIDEYLASEMSKGPNESKGNIKYHFQKYENVYNFFTILTLKNIDAFKILCIPQFEVFIENLYPIRTNAAIDIYSNKYYFPSSMPDAINKCIDSGARIVYFNLQIKWTNEWFTHSNFVLIDTKKKTIERFEPHGCTSINKNIDQFMKEIAINDIGLSGKGYKYLSPEVISPEIGIQKIADAYTGLCIPIGMMYFFMRIMNVDTKQKVIVEYFTKMGEKKLKRVLLKFTKYIENTLKEHADIVNKLNNELDNFLGGLKELHNKIIIDF